MVIVECIPQSVIHHCINHGCIVHSVTKTGFHQRIRCHGHVLHTACHNNIRISCHDHVCCHVYTLQSGSAYVVQCLSRNLDRNTGLHRSLTCYILSKACLDNASHKNLIYLVSRNTCTIQSLFDYNCTQIYCRYCA